MFSLNVKTDMMEPEFVVGDYIIISGDVIAENGDFVIVQDSLANRSRFKQLRIYGDKKILHPLNSRYEDIEKSIPRFYSKKEIKKILDNTPDPYRDIFKVLLYTGMRRDELRFLEASDIDLKRKRIHVQVKDGFAPKTSERTIPIHEAIYPILKDRVTERPSGLVFPNKKDKLYEPRKWWKILKKVCKDIEIPNAKIHTFRHTFASWLIMSGVDITTVSRLLGHSDIRTTMIYSHLAESHLDDAIDKLNI